MSNQYGLQPIRRVKPSLLELQLNCFLRQYSNVLNLSYPALQNQNGEENFYATGYQAIFESSRLNPVRFA